MDSKFKLTGLAAAMAIVLSGCGGGGGDGATDPNVSVDPSTSDVPNAVAGTLNGDDEVISALTRGFSLPSEISAVPAEESTTTVQTQSFTRSLRSLSRAASDLGADSDYQKFQTKRYVEERALEQFDIIEQVLGAIAQTNYADPEVINLGPYTAMVSWLEEEDGRDIKTLEPWVVDSRMIVIDGQDVNRILAWIEEADRDNPGETELVKAEFKIYKAANVNADGSFADYGDWDLNVGFNEDATDFFAASSRVDADGVTTLKINERHTESMGGGDSGGEGDGGDGGEMAGDSMGGEMTFAMKGVMIRGADGGYGKVSYPDWEACWGMDGLSDACANGIPSKEASYAYNDEYLGVKDNGDDIVYKDRDPASAVDMTHRYGLFYNETPPAGVTAGDNVEKHVKFGFPLLVPITDSQNNVIPDAHDYAYYGAWQGRHEIWGGHNGSGLTAGMTVYRGDNHDPDAEPVAYTTSALFNGTLTKRTVADGSLNDILNIQVETWLNKHWDLNWTGTEWQACEGWVDWQYDPNIDEHTQTCRGFAAPGQQSPDIGFSTFNDFELLAPDDSGRKWVNVGAWDDANQTHVDLVYNASGSNGAGFYVAEWVNGEYGQQLQATSTKYNPQTGSNIWVDVSGSIYIQYTGDFSGSNTGWVQKELLDFDMDTWTPEFAEDGDMPFEPELGREYYINNNGANFIVKRVSDVNGNADDYAAKIELQSAANPVNIATVMPAGTNYLATPWRPEVKFEFITDVNDANFMKLEFMTDDPNTTEDETGTVYENGEWGLHAYDTNGNPLAANGDAVTVNEWGEPTGNVPPVQFNWEYSEGGWGSQQFLIDANNNFVILEDPIALEPIEITHGGETKTLSLQFDGWFHGLPDMYRLLAENDWQMSAEIAEKVISIPAGTPAASGETGFYIKPLEVSVFLDVVTSAEITAEGGTVPDVTSGQAVDLTDVPTYVAHGMGAMPEDTAVLYSEGLPVEADE